MSLIKHTEVSGISYPTYMGEVKNSETDLASQVFEQDSQIFDFRPASYFSAIANADFLPSSSQQVEDLRPFVPEISGSLYPEVYSPSYQLLGGSRSSRNMLNEYNGCLPATTCSSTSSDSPYNHNSGTISYSQSSDIDIGYDEIEMRFKLEELERVLLNDTDVGTMNGSVNMDGECVQTVTSCLLQNLPMETSLDSHSSTSGSTSEKTPKQLLFDCAAAISEGNFDEANCMITELRQIVSIHGDPPQRLAAYLVEGLAARMSCSGQGIYRALKCKEPPTSDRLSAMQILFEVCPCFKFGFMAANGAISEVLRDNEQVHIVDFDINQGSQYISLLQSLANCNKKPFLRITGVDDPESVQRAIGGLKIIGLRLEKLAEDLGISFQFRAIAAKTADVTPNMLGCQLNEALVVNFAYQLHHMPDESVSTVNQRDRLLRMVKGLGPKLVTVIEQDVNTNTAPFFPRFVEVYSYYHAVFESLDATLPRDSLDRMNVERQCLARDMVNIVACEGADRIERYEAAGKWRARMTMAGFVSSPLSAHVNREIRDQLKMYGGKYKLKEEAGGLYFGWEDKILVVASAWR